MSVNTSALPYARPQVASSTAVSGLVTFMGRLFFLVIFAQSGPRLFTSGGIAYATSKGVPMASLLVPFSGLLAIAGSLSILLGYRAKIGGWLIALFLIGVTPMMHKFWGVTDPMAHQLQFNMFMKNLSMLGGALLISQFGAGPWTLDARGK
ncbi:MAG TPA: DoxX family protein [Candidatus Sulfotelmatobacter sp.]|jgi:putative oxidoreductase